MPELYDVFPRVVLADSISKITIRGSFPQSDLRYNGAVSVEFIPMDGLLTDGRLPGWTMGDGNPLNDRPKSETLPFQLDADTGVMTLSPRFRSEGEYTILLNIGGRAVPIGIYALNADLMPLRPFRGDMHIHSRYSLCNNDRATPEYYVAANAALGLDFMSISDHKQLLPSLIASEFTEKRNTVIHAYPGEEVHMQHLHNHHILNFGGTQGVSDFMRNHPDDYRKELKPYLDTLPADMDPALRDLMANGNFIMDKIHQYGGIAILCHPYWQPNFRFFLPTVVLENLCNDRRFDAIELLGLGNAANACCREMNQYCIAFWHDICIKTATQIPVVGNTDAHNTDILGQNCSIVFAETNTCENIKNAVRNNRSVAMDRVKNEFPKAYGDFRLVRFTYFLLRTYYPEHDAICKLESQLMFDVLADESSVTAADFARVSTRMAVLNSSFWQN